MDFVVGLLRTRRQHDTIWVIVDKRTKYAHFIPVKSTNRVRIMRYFYIDENVRWNAILLSIIFYRGSQFTSYFWRSFKDILGTQVKICTTFYP